MCLCVCPSVCPSVSSSIHPSIRPSVESKQKDVLTEQLTRVVLQLRTCRGELAAAQGELLKTTGLLQELQAENALLKKDPSFPVEKADERRTAIEKELETLRAKVETRHGNQANSKQAIRVLLFERWQRQKLQLLCQNFSSKFVHVHALGGHMHARVCACAHSVYMHTCVHVCVCVCLQPESGLPQT